VTYGTLPALWRPDAVLQIQSVLYNNSLGDITRTVEALARAVELAHSGGDLAEVVLRFGDSSSVPVLDEQSFEDLRRAARDTMTIEYDFFQANLGSARGHNRLASQAAEKTDFIWIQNPDVVVSPRLFQIVLEPFKRAGIGQVEAKQIPIEHPKEYNPQTGETEWTTTACVMTPLVLFRELNGFDADAFFMYCDDVDLALRIRELGYRLVFQPAAVCFHDKRLSSEGAWQPSGAERYYSAEAGLMMFHKWSYPESVQETLEHFQSSSDPDLLNAARKFLERRERGKLPVPRDPEHNVARFDGAFYCKHRFPL
jgi:GT2 family glycosyltransferase